MDYQKVGTLFNYIGGKGWLKETLRTETALILKNNKSIDSYIEPFTGGLGAFLGVYDILLENNITNVTLNDINPKLINFYKIIKTNPKKLVATYAVIEQEYQNLIPEYVYALHKTKEKDKVKIGLIEANKYFFKIRKEFNDGGLNLETAARLLFLQNHCFNGVYRENASGKYNTPFNWEAKVFAIDKIEKRIMAVNEVFKLFNLKLVSVSFEKIKYNKNTLFYLDPPYINEDETVENKYSKNGFSAEKQIELINAIKETHFIYSNHRHSLLLNEFNKNENVSEIREIARKNIISASNESRKTDRLEILVISN